MTTENFDDCSTGESAGPRALKDTIHIGGMHPRFASVISLRSGCPADQMAACQGGKLHLLTGKELIRGVEVRGGSCPTKLKVSILDPLSGA